MRNHPGQTTIDSTQVLLDSNRELIKEAVSYLETQGKRVSLSEWVTFKEYARRHDLESISVISNWEKRGIIPKEDMLIVEELNGLKLIKDKEYK